MRFIIVKFICFFLRIWFWFAHHKLENTLKNPQKAQLKLLTEITQVNNYHDFVKGYSISTYEDLEDALMNLKGVKFYEKTSGSSGNQKLIPYNQALLDSFEFAFQAWAYDLLTHTLNLKTGRLFLSISSTASNYDLGYLNKFLQRLLGFFRVEITDFADLPKSIHNALVKAKDLEIISIWSPTYLLSALQSIKDLSPSLTKKLWPNLKLISCWTEANSELSANKLKQLFPHCQFQGKGLLATEAPLTIPLSKINNQCVPLVSEVFMEFISAEGGIYLIQQLKLSEIYELLITTRAGLYRYKLGDFVQVSGFYQNTPCLSFVKKNSSFSDHVGEKLSEEFVKKLLIDLLSPNSHQAFLSINYHEDQYYYILYLDDNIPNNLQAELVDSKLAEYYHYGLARKHGQLQQLQICKIANLISKLQSYLCTEQNTQLGNLKDIQLIGNLALATNLSNYLQAPEPARTSSFV
jgi:hypothetical protein